MSFRISPDYSLGEAIQRLALGEIEASIAACASEGENSQVWETRRHLKRARAALPLLAAEVPRASYRRATRRLRNVARLVSDIRDAEVRLTTVREMRDAFDGDENYDQTEEMLAFELDNFLAAFDGWQREATEKLRRVHDEISGWRLEEVSAAHVLRALRRMYARGRDAVARIAAKQSGRRFNELRKAVKSLWYALRALRPIEPETVAKLCDELGAIRADLEHASDLCFVVERLHGLAGRSSRKRSRAAVEALMESREGDLQRRAWRAAERFYAERPREFAARLRGRLREWPRPNEQSTDSETINAGEDGAY